MSIFTGLYRYSTTHYPGNTMAHSAIVIGPKNRVPSEKAQLHLARIMVGSKSPGQVGGITT